MRTTLNHNFNLVKAMAASTAMFLTLASCTTNPATGKSEFTPFMSQSQEAQIGLQEHPKLLEQFGGQYDDAGVSGYVATVGQRLAKESELPDLDFTFTTLNSKVINAFALPGGFVYMSRGLLALMNDEAELSSVLGHEVGHVTARHSANRYNKSIFAQIAAVGVGVATGSGDLANLVNQSSQMYLLSYSRGQELQADELGVRYMSRVGYDPFGAPRMLTTLGDATALDQKILGKEAAAQIPSWARTHPLTSERVAVALQEARAAASSVTENLRRKDALLSAIDGMRFDDDPEQGVINGREFNHGQLGFGFVVPGGFSIENGETAVHATGPNGAAILFSGAKSAGDMAQQAQNVWQSLTQGQAAQLSDMQHITVNGMEAATGGAQITSNGSSTDFRIVSIEYGNGTAYSFIFVSPASVTAQLSEDFRRTTYSFEKLSAGQRNAVKGRVVKVVTVQRGDTLAKLAGYMAYEDYQLDRLLVLNGLEAGAAIAAGDRLKIVAYES